MASILRSSKFVRYIVGFTRNIPINTSRELDVNLFQNNYCLCNVLQRSLASQAQNQHTQNDQSLERSIRRLDQDVRRSGRISRRDIEDILEEIRQSRTASSSQSLMVIRCCGNLVPEEMPTVRTKLVQEIWKTLNKLNVPMDISHYNALLRVYLENEYSFSPIQFLADLEKKGIEPNRVTYQRLIARYCQEGDIEGATKILEFMREKQLPVNENVFNALILGHSQADDMESARGILSVMQQAGLEPSADTYTTLLCGYARKGDFESIRSVLQECESKDVFLLDKDYMDIIYSLAINNHHELIPEILSKMRKSFGYNQDAVNLILRLVNKEQEDIAFEVLKTMPRSTKPDGSLNLVGGFFIKQLIKTKRPVEKVISVCKQLKDEELNPKALYMAAETAVQEANADCIYGILNELKKDNFPIRQHYFWTLLASNGAKQNNDGVLEVLHKMVDEFGLTITGETLREYVIPNLNIANKDKLIEELQKAGASTASAASSIVYTLLNENKMKEAATVASKYPAYYPPGLIRRPLALAYISTNDLNSYVQIVRQIYDNMKRVDNVSPFVKDEVEDNEENENDVTVPVNRNNKTYVLGQIVMDVLSLCRKNKVEQLTQILQALVNEGLSIHPEMAQKLQERLGEELTSEITILLDKLTSGELVPLLKEKVALPQGSEIFNLERVIKRFEIKGESVVGLKRQLLTLLCRNRDLNKVEALLGDLGDKFEYTGGLYAQLIELYTHHENIEKALEYYNKLTALDSKFALDDIKVIKLTELMIKNNMFEDTIKILNGQSRERKLDEMSFLYTTICWRVLMMLAEQGRENDLNLLFDTLLKKEYIQVSNVLLGPLIKVHLVNKDLPKAMEQFEILCKKYSVTPWKNELACKLIETEDATNLQKLTDLSTEIHGEVNSLYDLVFAFVECGRIRQARRILETPGLRSRQQRVTNACERYSQEGQSESLEGLMEATKDLNHIDRSDIFYHLLNIYIKQDDPEKALGLWTRMQEEDASPNDEFLTKLGNFLQLKGHNVPFKIPQKQVDVAVEKKPQVSYREKQEKPVKDDQSVNVIKNVPDEIKAYRYALKTNDVDSALQLKNTIDSSKLTVLDRSHLIESLVKSERLSEAKKEVVNMLDSGLHPLPRIFRFFLNKLALAGDIDTLESIGKKLSPDLKKTVSYDNRLCHANIVAGKAEEFLLQLEKNLENSKDDQLADVAEKFPRGGAIGILETFPNLKPQFERMSKKYAERGIIAPMNVLWMNNFILNNDIEANEIWSKYLGDSPRLMFQRVVQYARDNKSEAVAQKLINHLKQAKVTEGAIGNAYSCLLDVQTSQERYEDALKTLELAIKDVCLENINKTALMRVKDGLAKSGKAFPYEIPTKNLKTSSSSSSDEDK